MHIIEEKSKEQNITRYFIIHMCTDLIADINVCIIMIYVYSYHKNAFYVYLDIYQHLTFTITRKKRELRQKR